MAKFSGTNTKTRPGSGPLITGQTKLATHEGGSGFASDAKTELFRLAVTNMVGEDTFYEAASDRDKRFKTLIHKVSVADPAWMRSFIPWLRNTANMRSASVVAAVEFSMALRGVDGTRAIRIEAIDLACQRADEPAEVLGYTLAHYGRALPAVVKQGVARAASRLYNEYSALKYDGGSRGIRMGDVIELTHPRAKDKAQDALFKHLLDRRHGHFDFAGIEALPKLPKLTAAYSLDSTPVELRRALLRDEGPEALSEAGYTWERLSGWLPGGMDAEAWEAIIPSMGYMALLRNLRNFEQAKVDKAVLTQVAERLSDPEQVVKSRQFPYRFWSAFKNSGTMFFGPALEAALEGSVANIPTFKGRTLVLCDTSHSMTAAVSGRSKVQRFEIAGLFASAVAAHSDGVDLIMYANSGYQIPIQVSVMRTIQSIASQIGRVGYGTETWPTARKFYNGHDRVVVFTDMQDHPDNPGQWGHNGEAAANAMFKDVPVYVWDLAGYEASNIDTSHPGHYLLSGFTDACFRMVPLLESSKSADWTKLFS